MSDDPRCNRCGYPQSEHGVDPISGRLTKCPAPREKKTTPPQEHERSPRGDY